MLCKASASSSKYEENAEEHKCVHKDSRYLLHLKMAMLHTNLKALTAEAKRGIPCTLYLHIFWVELYLTLYLNYPYRSGLVHWVNISSIYLSTISYTPSSSSLHKSRQSTEGSGSPLQRPQTFFPLTFDYDVPKLIGCTTKVPHFLFYKKHTSFSFFRASCKMISYKTSLESLLARTIGFGYF